MVELIKDCPIPSPTLPAAYTGSLSLYEEICKLEYEKGEEENAI